MGGQKVVLLIDEYDKPLVDYIDDPGKAEENRDILKNFFSVIRDITLVEEFEAIAGYTQAELETSFESDIEGLAQKTGKSTDALKEEIRLWYNGYSWGAEGRLYNPFSILNLFASKRFANYCVIL